MGSFDTSNQGNSYAMSQLVLANANNTSSIILCAEAGGNLLDGTDGASIDPAIGDWHHEP